MSNRIGRFAAAVAAALAVNGAWASGPLTNFTGLWWNPDESGWGLGVDHQGDIVFGTLFTYGADGKPTWYVMSRMEKEALNPFRGPVDNYEGAVYRASAIDEQRTSMFAANVDVADVGDAVLAFQNELGNIFTYNVGDTNIYERISPLVFNGAAAVCESGGIAGDTPNYQGLWVNAPLGSERWGVYLAQQGEVIFGITFAYDEAGNPTWDSMALVKDESGAYNGDIVSSTGPTDIARFDSSLVTRSVVGTASITFDGDNGTFATTLGGFEQPTKDIARMRFAESPTVCR